MGRLKKPAALECIDIPKSHTDVLWRRTRAFRRLLGVREIDTVLISVYAQGLPDGLQIAYHAGPELLAKLVPEYEVTDEPVVEPPEEA